jgi:hypothetical protein
MRRQTLEISVGLLLLLGPLGYALTLEPRVIEVERIAVVEVPATIAEAAPVEPVEPVEAPASEPTPVPVEPVPAPDLEDRLSFAVVNEAGLVLTTTADLGWGTGRLREHGGPGQFRAAKQANVAELPEALLAHRGRTFDVYGASGKLCTARLGELSVLAQHDGPSLFEVFHGSMDAIEWGSDEGEEDPVQAFERQTHAPRQIRAAVWAAMEADTAWLVAELVSDTSCEGALWARDAALPLPTVLHRTEGPSPIIEQRLAAHAASTTLAETKAAYAEWRNAVPEDSRQYEPEWADIERDHPASAKAWLDETGTPRLVELDFGGYDQGGCGDYPVTEISSVDLVIDGVFEPTPHVIEPTAVFDMNLDGRYELLYEDSLTSETPELSQIWTVMEEFYCPC